MNTIFNVPVSYYTSLRKTDSGKTVLLKDILEDIRSGKWEKEITRLRIATDLDHKKNLKNALPLFTPSGHFDERTENGLTHHANILVIDLDKLPDVKATWEILVADTAVAFMFKSCSGNGLAVGVRIEGARHKDSFLFFQNYFLEKYQLKIDPACQNISRARLVSYDPDLYLNENAVLLQVSEAVKCVAPTPDLLPGTANTDLDDDNKYGFCKNVIDKKLKYESGERHNYLYNFFSFCNKVGVAAAFALQKAIEDFRVPTQSEKEIKSLHNHCYSKTELHGTFEVKTANSDFVFDEKLKPIYRYAHKKNKEGNACSDEDIQYLSGQHLISSEVVRGIVMSVYENNVDQFGMKSKTPIANVENFISKKYVLRKNIITQELEFRSRDIQTFETLNPDTIYRQLQHAGIEYPLNKLQSVLQSDFIPLYDPFKEYFESLPAWDGEDHIENLANHVKADDQAYFNCLFKKALVRSIACSLYGKVNRMVMVLVSEKQEIGKSSFIRFLNPFGDKYYTEAALRNDKDSEFKLVENFIFNLEELSSLSNLDVNKLKATLSTALVKERRPYARNEVAAPRRCNFWGSTNKEEFLTDDVNTRWLCFTISDIDWDYSTNIDIHKVWAQAFHLYNTKFNFNLSKEESRKREERNRSYEVASNESDLLNRYFKVCKKGAEGGGAFYTIPEIIEYLGRAPEGKKLTFHRAAIGRALKQSGFIADSRKVNKKVVRGYWLILTASLMEETEVKSFHPLFGLTEFPSESN